MHLLQLPDEVLNRIFKAAVEHRSLRQAKNLRLCSKRLANIGTEELFEIAVLTPGEDDDRQSLSDSSDSDGSDLSPENWVDEMSEAGSKDDRTDAETEAKAEAGAPFDSPKEDDTEIPPRSPVDEAPSRVHLLPCTFFPESEGPEKKTPLQARPGAPIHGYQPADEFIYKLSDRASILTDQEKRGPPSPEERFSPAQDPDAKGSKVETPPAGSQVMPVLKNSAARFLYLQNHSEIRRKVKRVILKTTLDRNNEMEFAERLGEDWYEALSGIGKFPNLESVCLIFHPSCASGRSTINDAAQGVTKRFWVMKKLLAAFNSPLLTRLNGLDIIHLQNLNSKKIMDSRDMKLVLSQLDRLHLDIATETDRYTYEEGISFQDVFPFFSIELPRYWLSRACNLTSLSLGADISWGWIPYFEPRGLEFPKLKALHLYNYTLACDTQLDWLNSLGASLETLSLNDCPIIFYSGPINSMVDKYQVIQCHDGQNSAMGNCQGTVCRAGQEQFLVEKRKHKNLEHWIYNGRWHEFLPTVERSLPNLTNFVLKGPHYAFFTGSYFQDSDEEWDERGLEVELISPAEREPPYKFVPEEVRKGADYQPSAAALNSSRLNFDNSSTVGCREKDEAAFAHLQMEMKRRASRKTSGRYAVAA